MMLKLHFLDPIPINLVSPSLVLLLNFFTHHPVCVPLGFAAGPNSAAGNGGGSDVLCLSTANDGADDRGSGTSFIGPLTYDSRRRDLSNRLIRCAYCQREGATSQVRVGLQKSAFESLSVWVDKWQGRILLLQQLRLLVRW